MAADLATIRTKVRRLTRSPSEAQITTTQIDEYINTFLLYDMPQHLKLFDYHKTLQWYTTPNIGVYSTVTNNTHPLYDFKNKYTKIEQPVYIGGYQVIYSQSRDELFNIYPQIQNQQRIGTGDGINFNFAGTLSYTPIVQNSVLFSSLSTTGTPIQLVDDPIVTINGADRVSGNLIKPNDPLVLGNINYLTGAYVLFFGGVPASGQPVYAQYQPYAPARPLYICFFNNEFILRPIPDKSYIVNMEVDVIPTVLLEAGDVPELNQYWQYIAYGAAKKVFEDRMDMESVQMITPEFKEQEMLVQRKTVNLLTNTRVPTIYSEMGRWAGAGWWGNGFNNN